MTHPLLRDIRTIPNIISLSRIAFIFLAVVLYLEGYKLTAIAIGVTAGVTDYLDGILARKLDQVTHLGAILDQFSDLVFEVAVIIMMVSDPEGPPRIVLFVYLLREFWVGTIRRWMATNQIEIHSNFIGKLKTNFLGWCFMFYFLYLVHAIPAADPYFLALGCIGLYGGLFWSYLSAWSYTKQFYAGYGRVLSNQSDSSSPTSS